MPSAVSQLVSGVAWAVVGGVVGFYANETLKRFHEARRRRALGTGLADVSQSSAAHDNVIVLETGDPFFAFSDIFLRDSGKTLIVAIPKEAQKVLVDRDPEWVCRDQVSFDGTENFGDLALLTGIPELAGMIERHRHQVADAMVRRQAENRVLFNGATVGIFSLARARPFESEKSRLHGRTYKSDFFTQQVFASVFRQLRAGGHPIAQVSKLEELTGATISYAPFLGGLAATTFVTLDGGRSVILAERSEYITSEQRKWHYTMDEGFTQTDYDDGEPSYVRCFWRGLVEELNILPEMSFSRPPMLMDLMFHRDVFELEFTSLFHFPGTFEAFQHRYEFAKDRHLETYGVKQVGTDKDAVTRFLRENLVTQGCRLSLERLAVRAANGLFDA